MNNVVNINPNKLTEARQARGYNISQLAELVGVTRQSMSKYEQGASNIRLKVLEKISDVLDFPISFFLKEDTPYFNSSTVFYRCFKTSEENIRSMIKIKCNWTYLLYSYLNQYITMPKLNLPNLDFVLNQGELTKDRIQLIANTLRIYWGLGNGPILNIIHIFEKNGIIISGSKIESPKTDACSQIVSGTPVIFYDKTLKSSCRIRFSLAHELGHILLHGYITTEDIKNKNILNKIEKEANTFASCFLMPENSFIKDISSFSLDYLLYLKEKWKVSLSAIIYRYKELEIIDDDLNLSLRKKISYHHWNKIEPLDDIIPHEHPKLFLQAIKFLTEKTDIKKSDIISYFSLNIKDLSDIVSCSEQFWNEDESPSFSIIK